jgi:hypothetical protein
MPNRALAMICLAKWFRVTGEPFIKSTVSSPLLPMIRFFINSGTAETFFQSAAMYLDLGYVCLMKSLNEHQVEILSQQA